MPRPSMPAEPIEVITPLRSVWTSMLLFCWEMLQVTPRDSEDARPCQLRSKPWSWIGLNWPVELKVP